MITDTFAWCFEQVLGTEGVYTADPADPGNWTGGVVGIGECRGTKFGISAGAYPDVDIANLTVDAAKAIYRSDYWVKAACDQMVPPLAMIMFDAAVNSGVSRAAEWLQGAVGAGVDGDPGTETLQAVRAAGARLGWKRVCANVLARRIAHFIEVGEQADFRLGIADRLAWVAWQAMDAASAATGGTA